MKITDIKQQERLKGRYSIYADGRYVFSFSESALLEQKLHIGQELSPEDVKRYKKLSADDKAYGLALAYVARRQRSEWELTDYFKRKGYDEALGEQILEKLRGFGFVNDKAFAESWVANRRALKSTSKRRLQQELRQKRVSDDVIEAVLAEDETDELALLKELIAKKRKQTKYQDDLKLMQYLARQGFSYDDIKAALSDKED
jgi:regulatory protein